MSKSKKSESKKSESKIEPKEVESVKTDPPTFVVHPNEFGTSFAALLLLWQAMRSQTDIIVRLRREQQGTLSSEIISNAEKYARRSGISLREYVQQIDQIVLGITDALSK